MKGPLHERLRETLLDAIRKTKDDKECVTQTSLSAAVDGTKGQTAFGKYLNNHPKAGALDLDEADAVLRHVGSSLEGFLRAAPPRELTTTERMARALLTRPDLVDFIEDLLPVPKTQLGDVLDTARDLGRLASGKRVKRVGELRTGSRAAGNTKAAQAKRR